MFLCFLTRDRKCMDLDDPGGEVGRNWEEGRWKNYKENISIFYKNILEKNRNTVHYVKTCTQSKSS